MSKPSYEELYEFTEKVFDVIGVTKENGKW